jgi:hypothetical protein
MGIVMMSSITAASTSTVCLRRGSADHCLWAAAHGVQSGERRHRAGSGTQQQVAAGAGALAEAEEEEEMEAGALDDGTALDVEEEEEEAMEEG